MTKQPSESIRAIIVDDELPARENLRYMLGKYCPEIEVVGSADGPDTAEALFKDMTPELMFLDIRMPSGSEGFDLISKLDGEDYYVVFVTAFKDHAIRAFESRALHYILKPIDENDLRETVARLLQRRKQDAGAPEAARTYGQDLLSLKEEIAKRDKPRRITINHAKGVKIIDPADVSHLEGQGNCTLMHFTDGSSYLDTRTLKTYESLLSNQFFRIHRSYIVNMGQISEILHGDDQLVVLKSGQRLSVSRDRKKGLIEALQNLIW